MYRGRWGSPGEPPEWDIGPSLSHNDRCFHTSLRHWLDLKTCADAKRASPPKSPGFQFKKLTREKIGNPATVSPSTTLQEKLPSITKSPWLPSARPWSFASHKVTAKDTGFGSAAKSQKAPLMNFKRIIPDHVFKSRHATKEQIEIQARLRRSLSRQKVNAFKRQLRSVFEGKAAETIQCAFRQNRARNILIQKRTLAFMNSHGIGAITKLQIMWRYKRHMRNENQKRLDMDNVSRLMAMYDEDGSGTIDRFELKDLLRDLNQPHSDKEVDRWMLQMDYDKSGEVDVVELFNAFPPTLAEEMRKHGLFFDDHDEAESEQKAQSVRSTILQTMRDVRLKSCGGPEN